MATVKEILERKGTDVAIIGSDGTALAAARAMNDQRIGSLVVVEDGTVVGIVTERDMMTRVVAGALDPATTRVSEIMTTTLSTCMPDTPVEQCREVMTRRRIRRLPVIANGRLVGIVTAGDVMRQEIEANQSTIDFLNEYLESPPTPNGIMVSEQMRQHLSLYSSGGSR